MTLLWLFSHQSSFIATNIFQYSYQKANLHVKVFSTILKEIYMYYILLSYDEIGENLKMILISWHSWSLFKFFNSHLFSCLYECFEHVLFMLSSAHLQLFHPLQFMGPLSYIWNEFSVYSRWKVLSAAILQHLCQSCLITVVCHEVNMDHPVCFIIFCKIFF
jgi:hypothetical protein